jgi:hypothetical protein
MSAEKLQKILDKGDLNACRKFFRGMPESQRRELHPIAAAQFKQLKRNEIVEVEPNSYQRNELLPATQLAYFATGTLSEIKQMGVWRHPDEDDVFEVLFERKPDWIEDFVAMLLDSQSFFREWTLIRRLIAAKLATKPDVPNYYLGMIGCLGYRFSKTLMINQLLAEPDLLSDDIWKLFEIEGGGDISLANLDRFGYDRSFAKTFIELMNQGKLPRNRLLTSSLEALERGFNHYRAKWFLTFFDMLEPTDKELKAERTRFLGLLLASAPNVVTWAFEKVRSLAGSYSPEELAPAVEPLLQSKSKGLALEVIQLLNEIATQSPKQAHDISRIAATALRHEKADVQNAALTLIEEFGKDDAETCLLVHRFSSGLAASVRKRATGLFGTGNAESLSAATGQRPATGKAVTGNPVVLSTELKRLFAIDDLESNLESGVLEIPAVSFDGTDIPRLRFVKPLTPIKGIEELIDVAARVIEDGSLVDEVERCIDALARFCDARPAHFNSLIMPIMKRTIKLIQKGAMPFCGADPASDILGLLVAFCDGEVIRPEIVQKKQPHGSYTELNFTFRDEEHTGSEINLSKPPGFLSRRCQAIAELIVTETSRQLLSIPTHQHGWIDPREFAHRANSYSTDTPDERDLILAMLRLAPEYRADALKTFKSGKQEWQSAIRYALGDTKVAIGKSAPLWIAAARARAPWLSDERVGKSFPKLGPDAAEAAQLSLVFKQKQYEHFTHIRTSTTVSPPCPKNLTADLPTVLLHSSRELNNLAYHFEAGDFAGRTNGAIRWTATLWPIARDSFCASSAVACFDNIDWSEAMWRNRTMLEPLLDSGMPLRPLATQFLAGMLSAKEPGEAGLATDIAIQAISEGRLGTDNLFAACTLLLPTGLIKPGRWQKTLTDVASASVVHVAVIQQSLQQTLTATKENWPKDVGKLLELLLELTAGHSLPLTSEFQSTLQSGNASGKQKKLATQLLNAAKEADSSAVKSVLRAAIMDRRTIAAKLI